MMDIALLSMVMSQEKIMQQASMAVMKQAMGTAEQQAGDLIATMESTASQQAAQPHLGGNIDLKV